MFGAVTANDVLELKTEDRAGEEATSDSRSIKELGSHTVY